MTAPTLAVQLALFDGLTAALIEDRIESDGLTLDTSDGPVDLVAVERAMAGEFIELTFAEREYVAKLIAPTARRHRKAA